MRDSRLADQDLNRSAAWTPPPVVSGELFVANRSTLRPQPSKETRIAGPLCRAIVRLEIPNPSLDSKGPQRFIGSTVPSCQGTEVQHREVATDQGDHVGTVAPLLMVFRRRAG